MLPTEWLFSWLWYVKLVSSSLGEDPRLKTAWSQDGLNVLKWPFLIFINAN